MKNKYQLSIEYKKILLSLWKKNLSQYTSDKSKHPEYVTKAKSEIKKLEKEINND